MLCGMSGVGMQREDVVVRVRRKAAHEAAW